MPDINSARDKVEETVTRRRIISAEKSSPPPDFWDYVRKLRADEWTTPAGTPLHTVYVYRDNPPPTIPLAKCQTAMFSDVNCLWADQEEMEMAFLAKYGGGNYRMILKKGSERLTTGHMQVPGAYKNLMARVPESPAYQQQPSPYGANPQQPQYDPTAHVAEAAMHHMANAPNEAVQIGISALAQAAQVIKNFQPPPPSGVADDLQKAFMNAMIVRLTTPERDPIETYTRLASVLRESSAGSNGNGVAGSVIDKVLGAIVERGLNPAPSGPATSMGAELVRILPNVGAYVSEAFANYARIVEAQRDAIALQRGSQPGYIVQPPQSPRPPMPAPALPTPESNGAAMENPVQKLIEEKIIEIYREPQSAESAAEEALDFLTRLDRSIVPQLVANGEKGLMNLFETRPRLKPALANPSRLQEFVRAFLHYAGSDAAVEVKPN
jgi:hypothetical protein